MAWERSMPSAIHKEIGMNYRVHRFELNMSRDQGNLERFLNTLEGEIIAIIPNVTFIPFIFASKVDFLLIVEKIA
jgi:hypothetical protein